MPSCNINPILSHGSVMRTGQASAFGFPDPLIGVAAFAVVVTVGVVLLTGARLPRPGAALSPPCTVQKLIAAGQATYLYSLMTPPSTWVRSSRCAARSVEGPGCSCTARSGNAPPRAGRPGDVGPLCVPATSLLRVRCRRQG
ncbi:vitamin K epoxide reductase family protein [Kitasatospora cineracea]|uniref:vitamin K epoxide reductase family protein n=1 Tax=Kitasatospora cineracea TaxID=88074 RepID=UPI0033E41ED0